VHHILLFPYSPSTLDFIVYNSKEYRPPVISNPPVSQRLVILGARNMRFLFGDLFPSLLFTPKVDTCQLRYPPPASFLKGQIFDSALLLSQSATGSSIATLPICRKHSLSSPSYLSGSGSTVRAFISYPASSPRFHLGWYHSAFHFGPFTSPLLTQLRFS
jgi:hypothetical protein